MEISLTLEKVLLRMEEINLKLIILESIYKKKLCDIPKRLKIMRKVLQSFMT